MRAPFIRLITYVTSPRWRSPIISHGVLSKNISHVGEPWMPNLSSSRRICTVGPGPQTNKLSPSPPLLSGSLRANTSSTSPQPLVMNRFTPCRNQLPLSSSNARSFTACKSEPASGSVNAIAPVTRPEEKSRKYFCFISSDANVLIVSAIPCRPNIFISAASARERISIAIE
ncbi:hypothetical protein ES703_124151 [subsurface metagenome]